MNTGMKWKISE